ncbi:MAG TPA: hypothetical protein PL033_01435 [Candidatus Brocadiia bacterium]|nr:hypothetical protein [Candidatus Brocadiia bacterium]
MQYVEIVEPEKMHLMGLMLAHLFEKNLSKPGAADRLKSKDSRIGIGAGGMKITLHMSDGRVIVSKGFEGRIAARVEGTMDGFMAFGVHRSMVGPYLQGKLKIAGNPFALLPMLWLTKL